MTANIDSRGSRITGTIVLLALMAFSVVPLISLFLVALQPRGTSPKGLNFPTEPHWENFLLAWNTANMWALLGSSVFIALMVVPVSLLLSTLAGYALAKMPFLGSGVLLGLFILGLTLPFEAMIAPIYYQIRDLGLLNTQWAIIIPLIGLYMPFSVYWMKQSFGNMPSEP